jgi:hypothetical protein
MPFTPGRRFACPGLPSHTPNGVLYGRRHSDSWFLTSCASLRPSDLRSTQGERNEDFVLVEQSPGGVALLDGEHRVVWVNKEFTRRGVLPPGDKARAR